MKYKVGDEVRIKATNEEGVVTEIGLVTTYSFPYTVEINNMNYNFREGELCDPAPVKVGDILVNKGAGEAKVLDVFENIFVMSYLNDFDAIGRTYLFKEIEKYGWKIKGQESDKTQEAMNLLKKEGYKIVKE